MAQTIENNAVIENRILVVANLLKEKVVLPWVKAVKSFIEGKAKAVFKKTAKDRLEVFRKFNGDDLTVFGEGGKLSEISRSAWQVAAEAAKSDKIGATPMGALGIGLSLGDEGSKADFKEALCQAVIWAERQVSNEAAQAAAKAEAAAKAKADIEALFDPIFAEEGVEAWTNDKASDEEFLKAGKALILKAQALIRAELKTINEQGSGSTARSQAILDIVEEICSDAEQGLSDKTLHLHDKDGQKIWGIPAKLQIGTTSKKILEACQIKLSALQSKADRSLARINAAKGVGSIEW